MIFEPLDRDDNLVIKFTEDIDWPLGIENLTSDYAFRNLQDDITELENLNFFSISFEASDATKSALYEKDVKQIDVEWSIQIDSSNKLKIKFFFSPSDLVSLDGLDPDKIRVDVFAPKMFIGNITGLPSEILPEQENYSDGDGFMITRVGGVSGRAGSG